MKVRKRKISGFIDATEHPMDLGTAWNQEQQDGTYHAYGGDDIESFLKREISNRTPTDEIAKGETKPVTSNAVALGMVGMVTDIDVHDSEDGTEYVLEFTQRQEDGTEGTVPVNFPKWTDDDKVVINIDLTDGGGAEVPQSQYLPLGQGFTLKYVVTVGTAGGGSADGYQDLKARVVMKRGATVMEEFVIS